jgi:hypothetical protein
MVQVTPVEIGLTEAAQVRVASLGFANTFMSYDEKLSETRTLPVVVKAAR